MSLALRLNPCTQFAGHGLVRRLVGWSVLMWSAAAGAQAPLQASPTTPASTPTVAAPASAPTVAEAKAAHLHRFAGFVEWPAEKFASPDAPIVVGTTGARAVHQQLAQIVAGRLVQNRALQVVELAEPRQGTAVHILMVGAGASKRAAEWFAAVKGQPVLVVTDLPQGLERGATLSFTETEGRLRFEASVPAAEAAGLRLSSRLLSLAEKVAK